jgi:hypothetical protein
LITREGNGFKLSIYRKPTTSFQLIPADSNHPKSHKHAAFNSMFHRLFMIPMNPKDFNKELNYIFEAANRNGYEEICIQKIYKKHKFKHDLRQFTSLNPINEKKESIKYISMPYDPNITNKLQNELDKFNMKIAYESHGKLSDFLGSMKDKNEDPLENSGIYQINIRLQQKVHWSKKYGNWPSVLYQFA